MLRISKTAKGTLEVLNSSEINKCPWSPVEDRILCDLVAVHGNRCWTLVAQSLEGRTGKHCRERWFNHLNPDIKKGEWTPEEDFSIVQLQKQLGNQWAKITKWLPGRTDNAVKNRFYAITRSNSTKRGCATGDIKLTLPNGTSIVGANGAKAAALDLARINQIVETNPGLLDPSSLNNIVTLNNLASIHNRKQVAALAAKSNDVISSSISSSSSSSSFSNININNNSISNKSEGRKNDIKNKQSAGLSGLNLLCDVVFAHSVDNSQCDRGSGSGSSLDEYDGDGDEDEDTGEGESECENAGATYLRGDLKAKRKRDGIINKCDDLNSHFDLDDTYGHNAPTPMLPQKTRKIC